MLEKIGRVTGQKVTCEQNLTSGLVRHMCPVKGYDVHVFPKGWLITHAKGTYSSVSVARFDELYRDPFIEGDGWAIDEESRVLVPTGTLNRNDIMELANVFSINRLP